jgi:hypothetical protein
LITVAQLGPVSAPLNLAHFTTETQSVTNTRPYTNLGILVAAVNLVNVILLLVLRLKNLTKKLTVFPVKKSLLLSLLPADTVKKEPLKLIAVHNSNASATQNTAELQSLKTVLPNLDASLKNFQSLLISTATNTLAALDTTTSASTNQNSAHQPQLVTASALF